MSETSRNIFLGIINDKLAAQTQQPVDDELEQAYRMRDEALSEAKVPFAKYLYRWNSQGVPLGDTNNKWRKAQNIINKKLGSKKHYPTYDDFGSWGG